MTAPLSLAAEGGCAMHVPRSCAEPPETVVRARTDPARIRQGMPGPEGWTLPVRATDPRPDGGIRFEWVDPRGNGIHLAGENLEPDPPHCLVHVERMFPPDPTPDDRVGTRFDPATDGGAPLTVPMTLPEAATRAAVLSSGKEHGMKASDARLDTLLAPT
jgi:uncharacterized protein YndB with AHSA1/START domain